MAQWKQEKKELETKLAEARKQIDEKIKQAADAAAEPVVVEIEPSPAQSEQVTRARVVPIPETDDKIENLARQSRMNVTKPWEQMDTATPWKMDMLKMRKTRPGFVPRWVREDKIEQRLAMGYTIADRKDYEAFQSPSQFGTPTASYIMRGDLVLMEIPVEGYDAYKKSHGQRVRMASEDAKKRMKAQVIEIAREQGVTPEDIQFTDETKTVIE